MKKRSTASERRAHKSAWEQSGETKKRYCQRVGIKYATFISWFKTSSEAEEEGKFISLSPPSSSATSNEIVFPNGIVLRLHQEISSALLQNLYHV